jgi:hypothetical protein
MLLTSVDQHGFIAPTSMKRAGKTAVRAARAMVTLSRALRGVRAIDSFL